MSGNPQNKANSGNPQPTRNKPSGASDGKTGSQSCKPAGAGRPAGSGKPAAPVNSPSGRPADPKTPQTGRPVPPANAPTGRPAAPGNAPAGKAAPPANKPASNPAAQGNAPVGKAAPPANKPASNPAAQGNAPVGKAASPANKPASNPAAQGNAPAGKSAAPKNGSPSKSKSPAGKHGEKPKKPEIVTMDSLLEEIEEAEKVTTARFGLEGLDSEPEKAAFDQPDTAQTELEDDLDDYPGDLSAEAVMPSEKKEQEDVPVFDDDFDDDPDDKTSLAADKPEKTEKPESEKPVEAEKEPAAAEKTSAADDDSSKAAGKPLFAGMLENFRSMMTDKSEQGKKNRRNTVIIALLVVVIILLLLRQCGGVIDRTDETGINTDDWYDQSAIEGTLPGKTPEEIQEMLNQIVEEGMFNISIAPVIVFENSQAEGQARIENVPANHYNMSVSITLDATAETVYESKGIKPGQYIEYISLQKELPPGEHAATALFKAYDAETLAEKGQVAVKITVIVEGQ